MLFAFWRVSSVLHAFSLCARVYVCLRTESKASLFVINGHSNLIYYYILQKANCLYNRWKQFWFLKISDWPSFTSVAGIKPDFRFQFVIAGNSGQQELQVSCYYHNHSQEMNALTLSTQLFSLLSPHPKFRTAEWCCPLSDRVLSH